jgi:hypothetical protein
MVCPCLCGRHLSARNCSCSFPAATTNPAPAGLTSHLPGLVRLTASLITNHHQPSGFTSVRSIGAGGAAGSSAPAPAGCIDTSDGTTAALRKVALIAAKYWLHRYVRRSTDRGHGRHSALGGVSSPRMSTSSSICLAASPCSRVRKAGSIAVCPHAGSQSW